MDRLVREHEVPDLGAGEPVPGARLVQQRVRIGQELGGEEIDLGEVEGVDADGHAAMLLQPTSAPQVMLIEVAVMVRA